MQPKQKPRAGPLSVASRTFGFAERRCLTAQMRSSARQRLAQCSASRCLSSPLQVLARFHYRRAAVHKFAGETLDTGNLGGDRQRASGTPFAPRHRLAPAANHRRKHCNAATLAVRHSPRDTGCSCAEPSETRHWRSKTFCSSSEVRCGPASIPKLSLHALADPRKLRRIRIKPSPAWADTAARSPFLRTRPEAR